MIGDIHACAVDILSSKRTTVLLRLNDGRYKTVRKNSTPGIQALDPLHSSHRQVIGVFTRTIGATAIYEEAEEPMPVAPIEVAA